MAFTVVQIQQLLTLRQLQILMMVLASTLVQQHLIQKTLMQVLEHGLRMPEMTLIGHWMPQVLLRLIQVHLTMLQVVETTCLQSLQLIIYKQLVLLANASILAL